MTLLELQREMAAALMQPLGRGDRLSKEARSGAARYISPNDRLTAAERLEIYSRSYWYRLLDSLYEDFPGLRAILGERAFHRMSRAYLAECPSRSYTMRDLGSRLKTWLQRHPEHAGANAALALDMVRLEWAHIEAFDGEARPALGPEDLAEAGPGLRLAVQPYVSLLDLRYPVDDLRAALGAVEEEHEAASNAVLRRRQRGLARKTGRLAPGRVFVAVHRHDLMVYYRRTTVREFRVLRALGRGRPLGAALEDGLAGCRMEPEELQSTVATWFATWAELGWFCRPENRSMAT